MKNFLKEPLFHFLLLGAGLFLLFGLVNKNNDSIDTKQEIVVTQGRIDALSGQFQKVWQRPPTKQELDGLIQEHIREEVMYREAVAMGLDRDDTIVRRRMRQKLEFLSEDILALPEPSDEESAAYLREHPDAFRLDAVLTFQHVFLNADKRGDALNADVQSLLDELQNQDDHVEISELGDRFMLGHQFEATSEYEIGKLFGRNFTAPLIEAPTRAWHGPITSGYGVHLVYISERTDARNPSLDKVRDAVVREWSSMKRKETNEAFYQALRQRYRVMVARQCDTAFQAVIKE